MHKRSSGFNRSKIILSFLFFAILIPLHLIGESTSEVNSKQNTSYSLPIQLIENENSLPLRDFNSLKETIASYNLIPNRKIATALVFIGYELLEQKDPSQALEAFKTAEFIDKTYFPAYLGEAEALLKKNVFNFLYMVPYKLLVGLFFCFKDFWQLSFFLGESLFLILKVLLLSFTIFILVLFFKKESRIRHDIQEIFRWKAGTIFPLIVLVIILLIIFFGLGFFWLLLILGIVLFSYFIREEKVILIVFLLLCSLSILILLRTSVYFTSFESDFLRVAVDYMNGSVVKGDIEELTKYLEKNPEDFMAKFLLASMKSKFGIYNLDVKMLYSALELYNELKELKPDLSKLYNNTGNIYFTQRNYKKAILEYQKAVELDLDNVSAYFNLNLALRKIMEFDDANVAMEKAKKLDKDLVQFNDSLKIPNQNENIRLIPQELSFKELWDKVNTSNKDKVWFFTDKLWGNLIKGISHEFVPFFFPIIIITTLLTYFVRRNFTIPQNCEHCGETFCSRCKTGKEKKELCLKCTQLTSKGSSVSPELRITKIAQVRKFEKMENLKIKILSFLIPGCGHLYAGKTYYGILFLVFWIGISSIIITGIDIIKYPWNIHMSKILWIIYLPFAAIAISFYFFVNFFSIKLLDQEGP